MKINQILLGISCFCSGAALYNFYFIIPAFVCIILMIINGHKHS